MGKARRFNQYDSAVQNIRNMKVGSGLALHKASTFGSSQSSVLIGQRGTGGGQNRDQDKLPIRGGLLLGPIGFVANARAISTGVLDLGKTAAGVDTLIRGIVFVSPESGTTDTLDTIIGKERDGQLVILAGIAGNTITISHNDAGAGRILTPDDANFTLTDDQVVFLVDDVTATDSWRIIGTVGGGGGVTFPLTPDINARGNETGTVTVDLSLTTAHYQEMTLTGNITFVFSNPPADNKEIAFILDMTQDATGGRTVTWPASVRVDPVVGSGVNARTVVVVTTVDNGTNFDALIVTGGTVSTSANKALSNLSGVAINTSLISDTDDTDDLGSSAIRWRDVFTHDVRIGSSGAGVGGARQVYGTSSGVRFNTPTATKFFWDVNNVVKFDMSDTSFTGPNIILSDTLTINDSSTDPSANGQFQRNGIDLKVFSGGAVRNLSNIGGAEVVDNVFRIVDDIDSSRKLAFQTGGIAAATTRTWTAQNASGTVALLDSGITQSASDAFDFNSTVDVIDANFTIEDDIDGTRKLKFQTGGIAASTTRTLTVQDASGTIPLLDGSAGTQIFSNALQLNGVTFDANGNNILLGGADVTEVDDITFNIAGQSIATSTIGMRFDMPTGDNYGWRVNSQEHFSVGSSLIRFTNPLSLTFDLFRDDATPTDADVISQIRFIEDDDGGAETVYAQIDGIADDVTNTTEDGSLDFQVISAGTLTTGIKIAGGGTSTTPSIGFYNTTPITQQTGVAVNSTAIHAALVNLGLITA